MDSQSSVVAAERDCNALGGFFQIIINDLRGGANNWDDLLVKANKFHMQLKATITASTAFLDAFQKIADLATTTRSGTKEIGSALTRLCLRHRSVEAKMKSFTTSMLDSFILPLQDRIEEWKRIIAQLDKDHSKELKRLKQLKKKQAPDARALSGFTNTTFRIKRNPRSKLKNDFSRIGSMYDINRLIDSMEHREKFFMLEEVERNYVRRALIEERSHYCLFFNFLRPVVEEEISMMQEMTHLEEVLAALTELTLDPYQLPPASESLLSKLQLTTASADYGELDSPTSTLYRSRKSSISSITSINSLSTDSISLQNCKSLSQPNITPEFRPKSIASQDSGFISHDYNVPNLNRLTISSARNKVVPELQNILGKKPVPSSGFSGASSSKNSFKSIASCKDCDEPQRRYIDGEYASAGQIYSSSIQNSADAFSRNISALITQPIYANVTDNYSSASTTQTLKRNYSSDGSITPTNQSNFNNSCENGNENEAIYLSNNAQSLETNYQAFSDASVATRSKLSSKAAPPKPPARHSSILSSSGSNKPPMQLPSPASKSTRIYVVQNSGGSLDFPPPPPEAYYSASSGNDKPENQQVDAAEHDTQHKQVNYSCCQYSLSNSHLVLCNDGNCLKGIQQYESAPPPQMFADPYCTPSSLMNNSRKSYAFESNKQELPLTPIYSDCSDLIPPQHSHHAKPFSESDRARSVPSRHFHSTINLSHN